MRPDIHRTEGPADLTAGAPFEIGGRCVHPRRNEVIVGGERRRLEPRHMTVLLHLARCAGETVERGSLIDACWGEQIVGDESLTQAISKLRRALDDPRGENRLIETIPKIGYRLTCAPKPIAAHADAPVASSTILGSIARAAVTMGFWTRAHAGAIVLSGAVLLFAAAFGWRTSELTFSAARTEAVEGAREAPTTPPRRKIVLRMFSGRPDMPPSAHENRAIDL